jgi:CheY-like chemotaxis protein
MPTILVIDDDASFLDSMEKMLDDAGYEVLRAADGLEGVNLLEKQHRAIDLAIIDLALPGINGFEIIGAISRRPSQVKIIATTGVYKSTHLEVAGTLGAHAVIRKPAPGAPLPEKEWLGTVRQLLGPAARGNRAVAGGSLGPDPNSEDFNGEKSHA